MQFSEPSVSRLLSQAAAEMGRGNAEAVLRILAEVESRRAREARDHGPAEFRLINFLRDGAARCNGQPARVDGTPLTVPGAGAESTSAVAHQPAAQRRSRIGPGEASPQPGVSVVNCCMNRAENLIKAVPTWLALPGVDEVIIVDWNSRVPVRQSLREAGITDPRIRIARVVDEPRWILSFAFNLGFRLARFDRILKVDADITLKPGFFERNPIPEGAFVAGDWQVAEKGQEHINGFFYIRQRDLLKIRGFNEYITTYGWDDDDLYGRLQQSGLKRVCVDTQSIYHIPHDDAQRLGSLNEQPANALAQLHNDTLFKIRTNRFLASMMPSWNQDRQFAPFEVLADDGADTAVRRVLSELPHIVSDDIRRDAESYAATELVSWRLGPQVYHVPKQRLMTLLGRKRLEQLSVVDVALASCETVPMSMLGRQLVVVELVTEHPESIDAVMRQLAARLDPDAVSLVICGGTASARERAQAAAPGRAVAPDVAINTSALHKMIPEQLGSVALAASSAPGVLVRLDVAMAQGAQGLTTATAASLRRPLLVVDAQHGLGNRLRAYGSGVAVAQACGRDLVLVWSPDHHCDCRFEDLFEPAEGVTVVESADAISSDRLRRLTYMEIEPGACKDAPLDLDTLDDVLVRSAYVLNHPGSTWERENAALRALKPQRQVAELVASVDVSGCIGAHVRMEAGKGLDHNSYDSAENWSRESHDQIHYWRSKSHYSAFLKRIDALFAEQPSRRVFLATDLPETYEVFQRTYGDRLRFLPRRAYDRSREQIVYALADAILLSRCEMLLGSTWSSFSELAMRLSTSFSKIEMSGKDFT